MHSEHECQYRSGMYALENICTGNTNNNLVWAALVIELLKKLMFLRFGHGCLARAPTGAPTRNANILIVWAWMLWNLEDVYTWNTEVHVCSYGLGMDALENIHTENTNSNFVRAWMLWKT